MEESLGVAQIIMSKLIIVAGIGLATWIAILSIPHTVNSKPTKIEYKTERSLIVATTTPKVWTKEAVKEQAAAAAKKYNKSVWRIVETVKNESGFQAEIQSKYVYTYSNPKRGIYKGQRERSFGACQIHLPDHPEISKEEAEDPVFCTDFLAKNIDRITWYGDPLR